jgi:hypothetical protein
MNNDRSQLKEFAKTWELANCEIKRVDVPTPIKKQIRSKAFTTSIFNSESIYTGLTLFFLGAIIGCLYLIATTS